jgi:hypothetical protein
MNADEGGSEMNGENSDPPSSAFHLRLKFYFWFVDNLKLAGAYSRQPRTTSIVPNHLREKSHE